MNLYPVHAGNFKLDGGAMFGVVPKVLWSRHIEPDAFNKCNWALRCLIVETNGQLILIDTGMGNKQDEKFMQHYDRSGTTSITEAVRNAGFTPEEITDVFLTHLHFDHCGGAISRNKSNGMYEPTFKNATYWSNESHWNWATTPNPREKASFLKENILPIKESGQLQYISPGADFTTPWIEGIEVFFANGHTEAQMIPIIKLGTTKVAYMADLLPSTAHIPDAWVMGYDVRPLLTIDEKHRFLTKAAEEEWFLFLEHDFSHEICTVHHTDKGIRLNETHQFKDLF